MQPEKILESDSLDILFEHRNKEYGAYELRKKYNKRLLMALAMGLLVIAIPTVYIGVKKFDIPGEQPKFKTELFISRTINLEQPVAAPQKKVQPTIPVKKMKAASNNSGRIKIVKEEFIPKEMNLELPILPDVDGETGVGITLPSLPSGGNEINAESISVTPAPIPEVNTPFKVAEQMPAYPGGLKALRKFLEKNLESPRFLEDGEKVNVQVKFIVGYDGNLKSFEVVKDGGTVFNKEVIRVLELMPKWIPGKNAGKNVSVYFSLPVSFVPSEYY